MRVALPAFFGLLALGSVSTSCVLHLDRNAPGNANLSTPPASAKAGETERPGDPGENIIIVSPGGFSGLGFRFGDGDNNFAAETGVELSIDYSQLEVSHQRPDLLPITPLPKRRYGVNLGFVILEPGEEGANTTEVGPLYVEAHYAKLFSSVSAGYSYSPRDNSHGPQISAAFAGVYAKASYRLGRGFDAVFGLVLKWPAGIVWSR